MCISKVGVAKENAWNNLQYIVGLYLHLFYELHVFTNIRRHFLNVFKGILHHVVARYFSLLSSATMWQHAVAAPTWVDRTVQFKSAKQLCDSFITSSKIGLLSHFTSRRRGWVEVGKGPRCRQHGLTQCFTLKGWTGRWTGTQGTRVQDSGFRGTEYRGTLAQTTVGSDKLDRLK